MNEPEGIGIDTSNNLWVADKANNRVEKFSATGSLLGAYGSEGSGELQFKAPRGLAASITTGNVYVADTGNNRIEELSSSGTFIRSFGTSGSGLLKEPAAAVTGSEGNVYVSDSGNNRVVEFSGEGVFIRAFGSAGTGIGQLSAPVGLAISEGTLYVVDYGNNRVEDFTLAGAYLGQFGSKGLGISQFTNPLGIVANPSSGNLYVADWNNNRIQEFSPAGRYLTSWQTWGSKHEDFSPAGVAISSTGTLYVADHGKAQITTWTPPEAGAARLNFGAQFGQTGSNPGQFNDPVAPAIDGHGNLWVTDYFNNRIQEFSASGNFIAAYGSEGSGQVQFKGPNGLDVNQSTGNVYVADAGNTRIEELNSTGAFVAAFGNKGELSNPGGVKVDSAGNIWVTDLNNGHIVEFSSSGTYMATYGKEGAGNGEFKRPAAIAFSGENLYIADSANHRVQEISNKGVYISQFGIEGSGSGELYTPEGIASDSAGDLYVTDKNADQVQEFSAAGAYRATYAKEGTGEGQLTHPKGIAVTAAGEMYVLDSGNNRVEKWNYINRAAKYRQTIYYTVAANATYPECGAHAEWVGLPCRTQPAAEPEMEGMPSIPIDTFTYNVWNEVLKTTETFGTTTRVKAQTYDAAGRAMTSETTSSNDTPLPKVTEEYSSATGALVKQSTEVEGKVKSVSTVINRLGQIESYSDADGNIAKFVYDIDNRVEEFSEGKGEEESARQNYVYDPTTGYRTKVVDSAAGTFTAGYDPSGGMTTETYPNGMTATFARDATGQATSLEYVKTTHCTENCRWFTDSLTRGIHGETLAQTSSLGTERYVFDPAGRLTQTQEELSGKGCVARTYAYDEESNRTSLNTREPGAEGKCATEGGTTEPHIYDAASHLADAGVTYEAFGNITTMPSADTGEYTITSKYYVDSQLESQTENGVTTTLHYDPAGRTEETTTSGKTTVSHYSGAGEAVAWLSEGASVWQRNIPGIDGTLSGTQTSAGTITVNLRDLQGNVVATAGISETETKLQSTYNSTEFGVPQPGTTPPRYSWLGAYDITSGEHASDMTMPEGTSYEPLIGRALQSGAIETPASFPDGAATASVVQADYLQGVAGQLKGIAVEHEAALNAAAMKQAEEEAQRNQCPASECGPFPPGSGNLPSPTEGGVEVEYGEAESESGDPTVCHLHYEFTQNHVENKMWLGAELECNRWIKGLKFQFCIQELEGGTSVWNKCHTPLTGSGTHWKATWSEVKIECNEGRYYRGWMWWGYRENGRNYEYKELAQPKQC